MDEIANRQGQKTSVSLDVLASVIFPPYFPKPRVGKGQTYMPANFPTADQKRYYTRFVDHPTADQLGRYFHLTDTDRQLVFKRRHNHTRLGMALQVGTVRFLGAFLTEAEWNTAPQNAVQYVAAQLDLRPTHWQEYLPFGFKTPSG